MIKRENHEATAATQKERILLHENIRYKKRGKDIPNNNVFHEERNNLENTKKD